MPGLRRRYLLGCSALALLGACASPPKLPPVADNPAPASADAGYWEGRIAVRVHSEPAQAFSAQFALRGALEQGTLALSTPLGSTLGELRWGPGFAVLDSGNRTQSFASLDELVQHATGTPLPLAALFSWLQGKAAEQDGWQANLEQWSEGRIQAQRLHPEPQAELKVLLMR